MVLAALGAKPAGDARSSVGDAAGEDAALIGRIRRRRDGDGQLLPVDEISAYGMPSVHIGVVGTIGIVLEEELVTTLPVDDAVGVVHPVGGGEEVILRAVEVVFEAGMFGRIHRSLLPMTKHFFADKGEQPLSSI